MAALSRKPQAGHTTPRDPFAKFDPWQMWVASTGRDAWDIRRKLLRSPNRLYQFLQSVVAEVPRYRELENQRKTSLDCFPVISRSEVVGSEDHFRFSSRLEESSRYVWRTSGTTGPPLPVYHDLAGWYASNFAGYAAIKRMLPGISAKAKPGRLAVALVTSKPKVRPLRAVLPDLRYSCFEVFPLSSPSALAELARLCHSPVSILHGKPSYLMDLMYWNMANGGGAIRADAVVVGGECLFADQRAQLQEWFRCPVYDLYTSTEGGLMGIECRRQRGLHVLTEHCYLEVLTDSGMVTTEGTGEVLVTNLTNWGMAFVRYRTGDYASIRQGRCPCGHQGPTIVDLFGFQRRSFSTPSRTCPTKNFDVLAGLVREFRMEQTDQESFLIRWRPKPSTTQEEFMRVAKETLAKQLGTARCAFRRQRRVQTPGGKQLRYV
jgi:phenylacetate-CoA ligase